MSGSKMSLYLNEKNYLNKKENNILIVKQGRKKALKTSHKLLPFFKTSL